MMEKPITGELVAAYARCPREAFLLLCSTDQGTPHEYADMLARQQRINRTHFAERLTLQHPQARRYAGELSGAGREVLIAATLRIGDLETHCDALSTAGPHASARGVGYEPTLVAGTHSVSDEQELEVLFAGYVVGQLQRRLPATGRIVGMDGRIHTVPLTNRYGTLDPILATLRTWRGATPGDPPPVVVNRHCPQCRFQSGCMVQAESDDELSLLERMTPKARQRYRDRGIFTVRQLSYLYKPKRRQQPSQATVRHRPELQALALRTGTTYLSEPPDLARHDTELFLDIEGIPDRRTYYLFGLLVCHAGTTGYRAFWADTADDEEQAWHQLLAALDEYPDAPIYHYGSYEPRAFATLAKRYQTGDPGLGRRLVNLNAAVYGKVYFPVRSNLLNSTFR